VSTSTDTAETLVRVEKGHAEPEELAAITAVLLARAKAEDASATSCSPPPRSTAGWRRLERQSGFNAPHSWRS
jgi:hypothetical protein